MSDNTDEKQVSDPTTPLQENTDNAEANEASQSAAAAEQPSQNQDGSNDQAPTDTENIEIEQQTQTSIPPTPLPVIKDGENPANEEEAVQSTESASAPAENQHRLSAVTQGDDQSDPKHSGETDESPKQTTEAETPEVPIRIEVAAEKGAAITDTSGAVADRIASDVADGDDRTDPKESLETEELPNAADGLQETAEVTEAGGEQPQPEVVPEEDSAAVNETEQGTEQTGTEREETDQAFSSEKVDSTIDESANQKADESAQEPGKDPNALDVPPKDDGDASSVEDQSSKIVDDVITNAKEIVTEQDAVPPPPSLPDDSAVEHATAMDTMTKAEIGNQPINFEWTFGINRRVASLNLSDESRDVMLYTSSHVAVLYDFKNNTQKLLQGHGNTVTCVACSEDKRWLVTGEKGSDSCVIVWDTYTGIPVQVIFDIPGANGVTTVGMSTDAKHIVTINAGPPQSVSVWDWTTSVKHAIYHLQLDDTYQLQRFITFHPLNNQFFATNSESQVIFFCWETGSLEYYCPTLNDTTFNKVVGTYSQTLFQSSLPNRVLTATAQGNLAVWEPERPDKRKNPGGIVPAHKKRALKLVRVMDRGITSLAQTQGMVVSGNTAGHVTFFDPQLNLIMTYTNLNIGPVSGISFKYTVDFDLEPATTIHLYPLDSTISSKRFVVRDFIVSTRTAEVVHVETAGSNINKIIREHDATVHALAASPTKPWICIGSFAGLLKLWDYETKRTLVTRIFESKAKIRSLAFSHNGLQLAVGMQSGALHILDSMSLIDEVKFHYSREAVTHCVFSLESKYLATADDEYTTTVYIYAGNLVWKYLGRYSAHYKPINDIAFGVDVDMNQARLLTLGQDRILVEYDLANSTRDDLKLLSVDRIEQSAVPLCLTWYPPVSKETFLLTGNDQYKLKLYNTTTKMCRKTLLGPTYGTPASLVSVVPAQFDTEPSENRLLCYATKTKIGVQMLPLDGNPHRSTSCIAHPGGISTIACSYDGNYIFTAGGREATVHMWSINRAALEGVSSLGGDGLNPFYGLLDGGKEGQMFTELENYFYYAQLRSQGINTTEEREVTTVVPLDQVPFIMRALGFYPTEQEIEDMLNEVKFSDYVETGQYVTEIDLPDLIKLYINHRPAFGLSPDDLYHAFEVLGKKSGGSEPSVDRGSLLSALQRKGEHMTEYELAESLTTLLGYCPEGGSIEHGDIIDQEKASRNLDESLPEAITPSLFASEILGLNLYG